MPTYASGEYAAQLLKLNQLVLNVLTHSREAGKQNLSDLISTAASFRLRGDREQDPIMTQASVVAYRAASAAFKKYMEDLMRENQSYVDFETAKALSQLTFCEHKVGDFVSLDELETAAQKSIDERVEAFATILSGMNRALRNRI